MTATVSQMKPALPTAEASSITSSSQGRGWLLTREKRDASKEREGSGSRF